MSQCRWRSTIGRAQARWMTGSIPGEEGISAIIALIGSAEYARIFLRFSESPTKTNPPSVAAAPSWAVKNGCQACKIVSGAPIQELDHLVPMIALFSRSFAILAIWKLCQRADALTTTNGSKANADENVRFRLLSSFVWNKV